MAVAAGAAVVIVGVEVPLLVLGAVARVHRQPALVAAGDAPGKLPEPSPRTRYPAVLLDGRPRGVYQLAGYPGVGHRNGDPLLFGLRVRAVGLPVAAAVFGAFGD